MKRPSLRDASFAVALWVLAVAAGTAQPTDLFFSEYIEGSSNNKALEIYNGTGADINLASPVPYSVQMFFNGNPVATLTINLTGTVANGDVYVLAQSAASAAILVKADQTNGSGWFNGDDAVVLRKGTTVIDSIGQAGFDPGTEWGTGLTSTADNTLRRKSTISAGDPNHTDVFDPAVEWDGFATDNSCELGAYTGCPPTGVGAADPAIVDAGGTTRLTVAVTPGADPAGAITGVVGNLSSIGGSSTQAFFDDGSNGDLAAGDGTYSYEATVPVGTPTGSRTIPIRISDDVGRTGSASITVLVQPPVLEIFEIQGDGAASPYVGQSVRTDDNVVTAVDTNGFFAQTPDARSDASDETSNGIFVFTGSTPTVAVGDQVDIAGTVTEFFNWTEFTSATVTVDSNGNPLPAVVLFDETTPSSNAEPVHDLERFENMRVRVENGLASGPSDFFGDVPIVTHPPRPFREPGILFPGLPSLPVFDGNPEVFDVLPDALGLPDVAVPAGAVIAVAEGPLAFSFGDYQIWPTTFSFSGVPQVIPVRDRNPGEFTVGTQNVLRLFDTVDDPNNPNDPVSTPAEYAVRLNKLSLLVRNALKAPDVLVVQEAENVTVLQDLAAKIDADQVAAGQPELDYAAYLLEGNDIGGIDTGFLVVPTIQVDSVEQFGKDTLFSVDGSKLNDRPPLVLRGSYVGGTVPFPIVVIGVHQRSLSGIDGPSSGADRVRQKRNEQAVTLSQFVQSLQQADPDVRLVVAGDFNAFEFTDGYVDVMGQVTGNPDPAGALIPATDEVEPNLTNQTLNLAPEERYSFVFDGSAQSLDHAVTSQALDFWVRGAEHVRGNADSPASLQSDPTTALRSSDHDGTVLFLMGDNDGDGFPDDGDACVASSTSATVVIDGCNSGAGNDLFTDGCKITDRIAACAAAATTHEQFTGCVAHLTNQLKKDGFVTNKEKSAIQQCAGRARIP